ncbi:MAG TPA: class I SAM-dependent methyltransferase [Candidatus Mcinerneyibacterium sp.]|nr:class I SAM-dependent methyltransferase [Candidatus Mcinerneyibacterium sp.]
MNKINGWRRFFNNYAPKYHEESFTQNTIKEVDFLEEEFQLEKGAKILDVGCGIGRHAVELTKRGYNVTGLDISEKMLEIAEENCKKEDVNVNFIHADATNFHLESRFDVAICLCEGAFGLLSIDEDPFKRDEKILNNINKVLKPNAKFILTALNGLKKIREYKNEDIKSGKFDPYSITETFPISDILDNPPEDIMLKEKGFLATELKLMLNNTGFKVENIWGGTAGKWDREILKMDEFEVMIVSKKI